MINSSEDIRNSVGEKLKEFRKENKMTQQELADKLFVTNRVVSRWETGVTIPNSEQLVAISALLNVSIDDLMGCSADKQKQEDADFDGALSHEDKPGFSQTKKTTHEKGVIFVSVCMTMVLSCLFISIGLFIRNEEKYQKTLRFEAEWADIWAIATTLDLEGFIEETEYASNGQCISQFGFKGNTLTFKIISSEATEGIMYIAVVSRLIADDPPYYEEVSFDEVWNLYVNPTDEDFSQSQYLKTNQRYLSSDVSKKYYDFVEVPVAVSLKKGENLIQFVVPETGNGVYGLNMDYIRFEVKNELKWIPCKENKVRAPEHTGGTGGAK